MILDHATASDLLDRFARARETGAGDPWVDLFTDDAEYHEDPFGPPATGHLALRAWLLDASRTQDQVEFTVERHWVVPPTILAAWHASWIEVATRDHVRRAGFLVAEVVPDGRIDRVRMWWNEQRSG